MKVDPQRIESPFDEGKFPQSELHQLGSLVQNVNLMSGSLLLNYCCTVLLHCTHKNIRFTSKTAGYTYYTREQKKIPTTLLMHSSTEVFEKQIEHLLNGTLSWKLS